jgi:transitional endoplasmic reticulum ATPase
MGTATASKSQALVKNETTVSVLNPPYVEKLLQEYRSRVAHVFILYGNTNDFSDNSGVRNTTVDSLRAACDDNSRENLGAGVNPADKTSKTGKKGRPLTRICATYNLSTGLKFKEEKSKQLWIDAMTAHYGKDEVTNNWPANWHQPVDPAEMFNIMNLWFNASEKTLIYNIQATKDGVPLKPELLFTLVITDADAVVPDGAIGQMGMDRAPIVHIRNWAREEMIGTSNRIILLTRHLTEIHESIRGGTSGVSTISIPKPTMVDRLAWLNNYANDVESQIKILGRKLNFNGFEYDSIYMAEGFDFNQFAVQSAGMSRKQMEDVIMKSWNNNQPIDYQLVRERKQKALEDEYQGIIDFYEPEHGFEHIGGHTHLKRYFNRKVIKPLRSGDKRLCTSGMLMTGPPGTGKTVIAKALAKEAKMNFMIAHLDKLFDGLVGGTESKTRKFLEAAESAAPVIVFMDEMDSVLSSGRQSAGDSGTSARVFNAIMTWLSDDSRKGRIVVIGASNRPDLLDSALIRSGRFDAKIPALPPFKGDWKGRLEILAALCKKHQIKLSTELSETEQTGNNGLGRLLLDKNRVWTGAEIEVVLKEAFDNAAYADRKKKGALDYTITLADWNSAMDDIIPNTREVEKMTKLSLLYVDHLGYCPTEWREMAQDKDRLHDELFPGVKR